MNTSRLILVTGGCRSGKSAFALKTALAAAAPRVFLATAPVLDGEMEARVGRHRAERAGMGFTTIEEQTDLGAALDRAENARTVLLDCLTLWIGNLLAGESPSAPLDEDEAARLATATIARCRAVPGRTVIAVTNEVGLGIVPENALARRFRDLAGRVNACFAAAADEVWFCAVGLPLRLKPNPCGETP